MSEEGLPSQKLDPDALRAMCVLIFFAIRFRRLKCDEGKPACFRCTNSGIRCRGYAIQAPVAKKKETVRHVLVPLRPAPPSLSHLEPSYLELDEQEQLYFQDFAASTSTDPYGMVLDDAYRKSMLIDSFFWNEAVLPESHTSPCIRHGIVAVSALVKSFRLDVPQSQPVHEQFALRQYGKAIRALRDFIAVSKGSKNANRTLFVSCLVLAYFDCFFGNRELATSHMQCARALLTNTPDSPSEASLDSRYASVLMHLDNQNYSAMGFDSVFSYRRAIFDKEQMSVPECFSTQDEAIRSLSILVKRASNFYLEIFKFRFTPRGKIPRAALGLRRYFVDQLTKWDEAYCRYMANLPEKVDETRHPILQPGSLRVRGLLLLINLVTSLNTPQTSTDGLLRYFRFFVEYSRNIIDYEIRLATEKPYFDFEIRTIIPLYCVVMDCRNCPSLRDEALSLLLCFHRREGAWDSRIVARIAAWKIQLENEGMDEEGNIPEDKRLYGECFEVDRRKEEIKVSCRQKDEGAPGGHRIISTVLRYG
ncbi:putative UPC2 Regulatory involved in control of sterol uptake protein [Rutstroemia sp. NJR-2017a WRK4]|nr:putative UPC2 Regulatory involved in control of sterol uptake protein [Rutstroemia sp. NJR-2017a WRK4]